MTNFDFLKDEPKFKSFADTAIAAERIFSIDESASVLNCRRRWNLQSSGCIRLTAR